MPAVHKHFLQPWANKLLWDCNCAKITSVVCQEAVGFFPGGVLLHLHPLLHCVERHHSSTGSRAANCKHFLFPQSSECCKMEECPWRDHGSSSCFLTSVKINHLGAAEFSCYDDFLAKLCTSWLPFPGCLKSWPSSCRPPPIEAGWAGNSSVKLMDVIAIYD